MSACEELGSEQGEERGGGRAAFLLGGTSSQKPQGTLCGQ